MSQQEVVPKPRIRAAMLAFALLLPAGCGSSDENEKAQGNPSSVAGESDSRRDLPQASESVKLDPSNFTRRIDHPYWPLSPGSRWVYRETGDEGEQRVEVTVTDQVKEIAGVTATVVHDVVTRGGQKIEDTWDWYAQDKAGNVWYMGEDTKEYENGEVSTTAGSWEHGVDGAQAGIMMPANPKIGLRYRQEYYEGEAEDKGEIVALDERVAVPSGTFGDVLKTKDTNPLGGGSFEHKFYAPRVGLVKVVHPGGGGREELLSFEPG
jgi:hypothetical protein